MKVLLQNKVSGGSSRPTSAVNNVKSKTILFQNKVKSFSRVRPNTAHDKSGKFKSNLNNSLSNPFGSPDKEDLLYNGEDRLKEKEYDLRVVDIDDKTRDAGVMTIQDKPITHIKSSIISPIYEQTNKSKRPQSAKNAFLNVNSNLRK